MKICLLALCALLLAAAPAAHAEELVQTFHGMASPSVALGGEAGQLVVADTGSNTVRVYDAAKPGEPLARASLGAFLDPAALRPPLDLIGAARVSGRIFWLGEDQAATSATAAGTLFATTLEGAGAATRLEGVGQPSNAGLAASLAAQAAGHPKLARFGIGKDGARPVFGALAPPTDGHQLWMALRSPVVKDGSRQWAIVTDLINPGEIIGVGGDPNWGEVMLWDLGGLGVHAMAYSSAEGVYWIVAGPPEAEKADAYQLYKWSGVATEAPQRVRELTELIPGFKPEAIATFPGERRILLLSDDGARRVKASADECKPGTLGADDRCAQKDLKSLTKRTFRAIWLTP